MADFKSVHPKTRAAWRAWYHRTKNSPVQEAHRRERRRRVRHKWKARPTEIKTRLGCESCGERHPACLDFHHHTGEKKTELGRVTSFGSWGEVESEIAKCIVLCANCHLKTHGKRIIREFAPRVRKGFLHE